MTVPIPYAELEETLGFDGPYTDPPARRTSVAIVFLVVLCVGVITFLATIGILATTPPAWWPEPALDRDAARLRAREIENVATRMASEVRESDVPWAVLLREEDANTWLEQRLRDWVETTYAPWPEGLGRIAVRFDQGRIVMGVELHDDGNDPALRGDRIASFVLEPWIGDDQLARLTLHEVRFNRMVIPRTLAERKITAALAGALERDQQELLPLLEALQGEPITEPPVLALGDGRRVHLLGIETREGEIVLHCTTQAPARAAASR